MRPKTYPFEIKGTQLVVISSSESPEQSNSKAFFPSLDSINVDLRRRKIRLRDSFRILSVIPSSDEDLEWFVKAKSSLTGQ